MAKGILVVETSPAAASREGEYNDWYNDTHLVEVLKLSGFTSARRFKKLAESGHGYMALYEVEGDDLQGVVGTLGAAVASGEVSLSDVLAQEPAPSLVLYEQIHEHSA